MSRWAGRKNAIFVAVVVLVAAAAGPGRAGTPLVPFLLDKDHGLIGGLVPGLTAGSGPSVAGADAFALPAAGGYAGYASGTVLSASVGGLVDLARLNVASADAAYRSGGSAGPVADETGRPATPALVDRGGFARGAGLEVTTLGGLGLAPLVGSGAEVTSPPSHGPVSKETGPFTLDPVVRAGLLRNQAEARSPLQGCVLGSNLAYGDGQAAGVVIGGSGLGLGVLSTEAAAPGQGPFRSSARTVLVPGGDAGGPGGSPAFALLSEVRQTVAPVTFLAGTPAEFTLEVGGEWVLSARADGRTGSVSFGPEGNPSAEPVLRVVGPTGVVIAALTVQDVLGRGGQVLSVPGVAEIAVGEQPRPLLGAAGPLPGDAPTAAAAAVDVARVRLLAGGAEVRVGHMEAAVAVPAGGPPCPAPKAAVEAQPASLPAGSQGEFVVTVTNPNDGRLEALEVDLTLSGIPGAAVDLGTASARPAGPPPSPSGSTLRWSGFDPLGPGESQELRFTFRPPANALAGRITAALRALGHYRMASAGPTVVDVPVTAEATGGVDVTVPVPAVGEPLAPPAPAVEAAPTPAPSPPTRRPVAVARPRSLATPSTTTPAVTSPPEPNPTVPPAPPPGSEEAAAPGVVPVPDVRGLPLDEASARLRQAGFTVAVNEAVDAGPEPAGHVVGQLPAAGTPAPLQSTITVLVRPERALPPAPRREGADRGWLAFAALVLALTIGVLTVRHGRSRQRHPAA
jgi:hypothetical protein